MISAALCFCLLSMICPMTSFAAAGNPFSDVTADDWFYDPVQYVYENGLMHGTGGHIFEPDGTTTRGMVVTILYNLEGTPVLSTGGLFQDVAVDSYYEKPIAWASLHSIVTGYSPHEFGPDDAITREQMATILYHYAEYKQYDVTAHANLNHYTDVHQISTWAASTMAWANAEGIINGISASLLAPKDDATRAQAAAIFTNFHENIENRSGTSPNLVNASSNASGDSRENTENNSHIPDTTVYYTITFEVNGGSPVAAQIVIAGDTATRPANPDRNGYIFSGWYSDSALSTVYNFDDAVIRNVTLYAKWTDQTHENREVTSRSSSITIR